MKKIATYFIALAACVNINSVCNAQSPTITTAAFPLVGYTYSDRIDTTTSELATFTVSPGSASMQTWNYAANFVTTYTGSTTFVSPSTGAGNSNFPSSNLAVVYPTMSQYFLSNSSGLVLLGIYMTGSIVPMIAFTPNELWVPTPFTYGNVRNNLYTSTYTFTSGGINYKSSAHYNRTITADAFGTLTIPTGTYPNCLRQKTFDTSIDTLYMQVSGNWNFLQRSTDSTTTYNWLQNNSNTFNIMTISFDKKLKVKSTNYFTSFNNDITVYARNDESVNIFPNPSNEVSYVNYENKLAGHVDVSLLDLNGNLVSNLLSDEQGAGTQQLKVDISSMKLAKGLYFVHITNKEGAHTLKFSVN